MKRSLKIVGLGVVLLLPLSLQAGTLTRYIWSDSKGFVALDPTCQVQQQPTTPLNVAQKPDGQLASASKLKGKGFFAGLVPGNLLDRSIVSVSTIPTVEKDLAQVQVVSVPTNAIQPKNTMHISQRGDEGTMASNSLQEIGNFVIEVLAGPTVQTPSPIKMQQSYWQAALENEKYVVIGCGDVAKMTFYTVFDVYSTTGIDPIAQVGVSATETSIFTNVKVLTPDEANQEASGDPLPPEKKAPAKGGVVTPGAGASPTPSPTPANSGVAPTPAPPADISPDDDEGGDATPGDTDAGLGYVICTTDKTVPVLDKDLKPVFTANQFEPVIPNQTWDEKQKSTHLEVQFPNRKDVVTGWVPRGLVQLRSDCAPLNNGKDGGVSALDPDYTNIILDASVSRKDCCKFPTRVRPSQSYTQGTLKFRASRNRGRRLHAGADIYRRKGDPAVAVASGNVIRSYYYFYQGVFAVEVKHPQFIARYGEVLGSVQHGIAKGNNVVAGQPIGLIGKVNSGCCTPMLHFELYKGTARGPLSRYRTPPYDRRPDVMDPTAYLKQWEKAQFGKSY